MGYTLRGGHSVEEGEGKNKQLQKYTFTLYLMPLWTCRKKLSQFFHLRKFTQLLETVSLFQGGHLLQGTLKVKN